ncbi:MAG TPA: putative glycoside hydrolase, partial [Actinomycetota bacterium]|nr:putative glycoside hydrolase [Actinomycetota bacterium]
DYSSGVPINPATGQPWTTAEWLNATSALAARVKAAIAPRTVFVNGLGSGPRYANPAAPSAQLLNGIDGGHAEAFLRNANEPISRYPTAKNWLKEVDMLMDATARGKSVLTLTKVWAAGTQAEKDAWHRYALASFLMGASEKTYFTFQYAREDDPTVTMPLWSTLVGSPLGNYFVLPGGAYQRSFANGISVVNPSLSPVTLTLAGTYRTLQGELVTSLTLQPNQGDVLIRVS